MYPAITPLIRDAIKRRYELIPYLYSSALESHMTATPPQRWVGWGYESDPEVWTSALLKGETQYWLGSTLLVGGVYEPGIKTARIYLPSDRNFSTSCRSTSESIISAEVDDKPEVGYINLNKPYQHLTAGQWATIDSEWQTSVPILAKIGGAVPVGKPAATSSPLDDKLEFPSLVPDDYRGVEIFPPKGSSDGYSWSNTWYEDDGVSSKPSISTFMISYSSTETDVLVKFEKDIEKEGGYVPMWKDLTIILPVRDERMVTLGDGEKAVYVGKDERDRGVFKIAV